jgi:rRNA maturation endonuclease Nob1
MKSKKEKPNWKTMGKYEMECLGCGYSFKVYKEDIEKKRKCPKCGSRCDVFGFETARAV